MYTCTSSSSEVIGSHSIGVQPGVAADTTVQLGTEIPEKRQTAAPEYSPNPKREAETETPDGRRQDQSTLSWARLTEFPCLHLL